MREIQLGDEENELAAAVDEAARGQPSLILRGGRPEAVVVGYAEWQRITAKPSFAELLLACPLEPGDLPERDRTPPRDLGF